MTMRQALAGLKYVSTTDNFQPFMLEMHILGLIVDGVPDYPAYIKHQNKDRAALAFEQLHAAVKETAKTKILGTEVQRDFKIFENCTFGAANEMVETLDNLRIAAIGENVPSNKPVSELSTEEKTQILEIQERLFLAYYDQLPRILGLVVAGIRGEDGSNDYLDAILNEPAIPALAVAGSFFLNKAYFQIWDNYPNIVAFTTQYLASNKQNYIGEYSPKTLLAVHRDGF